MQVQEWLEETKGWSPGLVTQLEREAKYLSLAKREELEAPIKEALAQSPLSLSSEQVRRVYAKPLYYAPHFWYEEIYQLLKRADDETADQAEVRRATLQRLYAYAPDGRRLFFLRHLGSNPFQYVFLARMTDRNDTLL